MQLRAGHIKVLRKRVMTVGVGVRVEMVVVKVVVVMEMVVMKVVVVVVAVDGAGNVVTN